MGGSDKRAGQKGAAGGCGGGTCAELLSEVHCLARFRIGAGTRRRTEGGKRRSACPACRRRGRGLHFGAAGAVFSVIPCAACKSFADWASNVTADASCWCFPAVSCCGGCQLRHVCRCLRFLQVARLRGRGSGPVLRDLHLHQISGLDGRRRLDQCIVLSLHVLQNPDRSLCEPRSARRAQRVHA